MNINQIIKNGEVLAKTQPLLRRNHPLRSKFVRTGYKRSAKVSKSATPFWGWGKQGATPAKPRRQRVSGTFAARTLRSLAHVQYI